MSEQLPNVTAMSIDHPRPHLLGWGEDGPPIGGRTAPCDICHTPPGRPHLIVTMGVEETTRRLSARSTPAEAAQEAAPRAEGLDVAAEVAYEMKVFLHGAKSAPPIAPGWLTQIEKWRARLSRPSDERVPHE